MSILRFLEFFSMSILEFFLFTVGVLLCLVLGCFIAALIISKLIAWYEYRIRLY